MFRRPAVFLVLGILLLYSLCPLVIPGFYISVSPGLGTQTPTLFEANYWSYFYSNVNTALLFPLYTIYAQTSFVFFEKESVITRFRNVYLYWKAKLLFLLADTFAFVLYIHIILTVRFAVSGGANELAAQAGNILLCVVLNTLGMFSFSAIFQFMQAFTGNSAVSFCFSFLFVIYGYIADCVGLRPSFIGRALSIYPEHTSDNLVNLCIVLFFLTIIVTGSICILANRDYLIPRVKKDAD